MPLNTIQPVHIAPAPAPATHPWWQIMARIIEVMAAAAPAVIAIVDKKEPAAAAEAAQLGALAGALLAPIDGSAPAGPATS